MNWKRISEINLWKELCFCILSANVQYELAFSTMKILWKKCLLDSRWLLGSPVSKTILLEEMSMAQFFPKTKIGRTRKYRYPSARSESIVDAAKAIYSRSSLKEILSGSNNPTLVRKFLYDNIPGLGIKEASHFLRNISYCNSLAIIDVHVLSFLIRMNLISNKPASMTLKKYILIEQLLNDLVSYYNLELGLFDLAIWHYMRN